MKYHALTICLLLCCSFTTRTWAKTNHATVTVFPAPTGVKVSPHYKVSVQRKPVFVYGTYRQDRTSQTKIAGCPVSPLAFTIFDFTGSVQVQMQLEPGILKSDFKPVVRPLASNIKPVVNGNTVTITLDKPGNYTLDPRGDGYCALHLFTNPPEVDVPDSDDPNVIYFGSGVHEIDSLIVKSDQTLYLAGGAVLLCKPTKSTGATKRYGIKQRRMKLPISIQNAKNVTVRGRGVISCAGGIENQMSYAPMRLRYLENFTLKDVVLLESNLWNVSLQACRNVNIDNLRIVSFYVNSDGICATTHCDDIRVTNCFVHNADDSLEVKAMDSFWGTLPPDSDKLFGPCRNILFENCQVWNDLATPMGITHEIAMPIDNVTFRNITVLHHTSKTSKFKVRGQISIFPAGGGTVSNVTFENITVESATTLHPYSISIDNTHERWFNAIAPHYAGRPYSKVQNVLFKNINMNTKHPTINLKNWSDTSSDISVRFENIMLNGKKLTQMPDAIQSQNADYQVVD